MTEEERKEKLRIYCQGWRERNPDYMRTYYYRSRTKQRKARAKVMAARKAAGLPAMPMPLVLPVMTKEQLDADLQAMENRLKKLREQIGGRRLGE